MLRVPRTALLSCMESHSEVAMLVLKNLVKRLRDADRKIESLALIEVYGRVAGQAGNRPHDRRFPGNGQPGDQGSAGKKPDPD